MNPLDKIHPSWKPILKILEEDLEIKALKAILPNIKYFPSREDIFNVFQMPLQDIKVVILGQDPYPAGQAIGYAFAVNEVTNKPVSLRIIEKEVGHEIDKTLFTWRKQGVLLLNTALTVEAGKAGSHLKYWENFTYKVIEFIEKEVKPVWILWGAKAQAFKKVLQPDSIILQAPHPAAESYSGGTAGFYGCKHFEKVNEILTSQNKSTIVW